MIISIIEAALRSVLVALAVWVGLRAFRVSNVLAQKAAWGLVLAAAALMPMLLPLAARLPGLPGTTFVLPAHLPTYLLGRIAAWRSAPQTAVTFAPRREIANIPAVSYVADDKSSSSARYPAPTISNSHVSAPAKTTESKPAVTAHSFSLIKTAWLLYLAVAGLFVFRLLYGLAASVRILQTAEPVYLESSSTFGAGMLVRSSSGLASPVTIGSAVILPEDYKTWDSEKLRIVLAHERSHIRQGDFYLQLLAGLYAAFFWFSPLGWWLKRTLTDLAEAISDRAGLEEAASRSSYAQILLEFAAAPRPTLIGVAMARPGSLSRRIERLLNDSSFRQAFAGTRRRALLAVLLVPVALFAATTLVRVEAAGQAPAPPAPPGPPNAGVSTPEAPTSPDMAAPALAAVPAALPPSAPDVAPPPAPVLATPPTIPAPPVPPAAVGDSYGSGSGSGSGYGQSTSTSHSSDNHNSSGEGRGYHYSYSTNGDSYAIIRGDGKNIQFSGEWVEGRREDFAKARTMAHGDFLWFTRGGKSYLVDDAAVLAQIEDMYKPMEALGKQQEELGRQQEDLGRRQEELGREQEKASIPTPDMSKEIAEIEAAAAKLKASKAANMNAEEFAELQSKLGDLQGKMGELQGRLGSRQGEFGEKMGKLGAMQGELGAKQGRLGAEQGRIAREADQKVNRIIEQSLKNGTAKPIQ